MKPKTRWILLVVVAMAVVLAVGWWRSRPLPLPTMVHRTLALDTYVEVTVPQPPAETAEPLRASLVRAVTAMTKAGEKLNFYNPRSALNRLNRATDFIVPDPLVSEAVLLSVSVARATDGALDPTMGFVSQYIWRFDQPQLRVPEKLHVIYARPFYGWEGVKLRPAPAGVEIFRATPRLSFDLGAVNKGYALAAAAAYLRESGQASFLINAGGDVVAGEAPAPGRPWTIGIQHPRRDRGLWFTRAQIANEALATSGDYEKCVFVEGIRYHHVIDPQTGYPADASLSATVIAPDPQAADALATAAFVLGEAAIDTIPRAAEVLGYRPQDVSVLVVLPSGRVVHSDDERWLDCPDKLKLIAPPDSREP